MKHDSILKTSDRTTREYFKNLGYPLLLLVVVFTCIGIILPKQALFGSEGDWFCQHAAVAEQYRQSFYDTGNLFPDWLPLGGGSNSYDFSYYGFLRPDVLISYLLPSVPMTLIISWYAILELAAGTVLCYFWIKRHVSLSFFAFLGALLYSCAACFSHAHNQIMFVNYMPFLILALWGVESLIKTRSIWLLTIALFLVCIHSYYFAPAVLIVCSVYFLNLLLEQTKGVAARCHHICRFAMSAGLALGMAAILLLPTGIDLLSTSKDAGTPATLQKIFSLSPGFDGLLYHPYSCGLTVLSLYTLLQSIRRKSTRVLGVFLMLCLTINTFPYLLSGLLYVRYKVLIPLVPQLLLLCAKTLEALFLEREKHSFLLGAACLAPAAFSKYSTGILADCLWMFVSFLVIFLGKKFMLRKACSQPLQEPLCMMRKALPLCLLLCVPAVCLSICIGQKGQYLSASDDRQELLGQQDLSGIAINQDYRFESLIEPYVNVNTQPLSGIGRTSMYSSVTDSNYAGFYYDTMRNPIRIRNRVALMTDANPFFSYFMGIRYILAKPDTLPLGYKPLREMEDSSVLAENSQVLPIAYTSASVMSEEEFEKLSFPYTLEALARYTIVPNLQQSGAPTAEEFLRSSRITPVSEQELQLEPTVNKRIDTQKKVELSIPIPKTIRTRILILSADVASPHKKEVTVDINQSRNKLSGKSAPYPNHNDTFTWIISSNEILDELTVTLSPGDYNLTNWQIWSMETEDWGNHSAAPLKQKDGIKSSQRTGFDRFPDICGSLLVQGEAELDQSGFLVTSLPYRQGYKAYVDGTETQVLPINETFVGFPLPAGTYEIAISYSPPGKIISIWVSLTSLLLFLLWELLHYVMMRKSRRCRIDS